MSQESRNCKGSNTPRMDAIAKKYDGLSDAELTEKLLDFSKDLLWEGCQLERELAASRSETGRTMPETPTGDLVSKMRAAELAAPSLGTFDRMAAIYRVVRSYHDGVKP